MAKFRKKELPKELHTAVHHGDKALSKEELDAKHQAALEAKSIISWKAPERIFKARSKKYFTKVALYGLVLILAAIAFGEFFLVGVIISIIFVVYVLATSTPNVILHKITNMGIISGGRAYLWEDLDSFWFDRRGDDRVLLVQTRLRFPTRLIMILTTVSERTLLDILERHLHFHHAPVHTLMDKWANSVQKRINLD